jgi:hypothetical protein
MAEEERKGSISEEIATPVAAPTPPKGLYADTGAASQEKPGIGDVFSGAANPLGRSLEGTLRAALIKNGHTPSGAEALIAAAVGNGELQAVRDGRHTFLQYIGPKPVEETPEQKAQAIPVPESATKAVGDVSIEEARGVRTAIVTDLGIAAGGEPRTPQELRAAIGTEIPEDEFNAIVIGLLTQGVLELVGATGVKLTSQALGKLRATVALGGEPRSAADALLNPPDGTVEL